LAKGQIITTDFMMSLAIFLVAIAVVTPLFLKLSEDSAANQLNQEAMTRLDFAGEIMMKTPGVPADWNPGTVESIGLADSNGRINRTKIRNMMEMNATTVKILAGLQLFNFNISFYSSVYPLLTGEADSPAAYFSNSNNLLSKMNGSGLVYDVYSGGAAEFNSMLANQYRTIIVEDTALTQAQIDANSLRNFVRTGGILIVTGNANIIGTGFNMSSATTSGASTVADTAVIDAPYGSNILFSTPNWYFFNTTNDSPLHIIASAPGGAYVCRWNYGTGRVFFATGIDGTVNGEQLIDAMNVIGARAELVSGPMQTAFVNARAVVYDTEINSLGRAVMAVGR
jgi:hypothetical protein